MPPEEPDPFEELGVSRRAEQEVVEAAYLALIKKYHPDHFPGDEAKANERAQRLNAAFAAIGTSEKRAAWGTAQRPAPAPPEAAPATPGGRRRGGARIRVARYFSRRDADGASGRTGMAAMLLIAATLAVLALWAAETLREWNAGPAENRQTR